MTRSWNVDRQITPQPDGQMRWDLAFQCLLKWAQTEPPLCRGTKETTTHENRHLRPSIDTGTAANTDYSTVKERVTIPIKGDGGDRSAGR